MLNQHMSERSSNQQLAHQISEEAGGQKQKK